MSGTQDVHTIGSLAKASGVGVETIRFYQRKGLVTQPRRPLGGIRRYGPADVARLRFVKAAQQLGFSLDEVADLLRLEDGTHCREARRLAEHKLVDVQAKLAHLSRIESTLSEHIGRCGVTKGRVRCPLIASLQAR